MAIKLATNSVSHSATIRNGLLVHHEQTNGGEQNDRTNYLPLIHAMRESAQRSSSRTAARAGRELQR
jgi:hypothetical protein